MADDNQTTQGLLEAIQQERAKFDDLLASFDDEAMHEPVREDGWTPKDILAHVTAWEQRLLRWIGRWLETGDPGRPEVGVTWEGMDEINDTDYRAAKEQRLANVRKDAWASYDAVLRALGELSDDELAAHPEAPNGPTWAWIAGANTYEHYQEHREEVEAFRKEDPA